MEGIKKKEEKKDKEEIEEKEEIKETTSLECSSKDYVSEDFDWVDKDIYSKESKLEYLKFPLKEWKDIIYEKNDSEYKITSYEEQYQDMVNKILKLNIFNGFNFFHEKGGIIKYKLAKYNTDIKIAPDFFVYRMEKSKFIKLLKERKYMMKTKYEVPENIKYISIIGEIKMSRKKALKSSKQKKRYDEFAKRGSNEEEKLIVMYVYDQSFILFKEDEEKIKTAPIVYCYIPKLYNDKCYKAYNNVVSMYKQNKEIIDLETGGKHKYKNEKSKAYDKLNAKYKISIFINASFIILYISNLLYNYFKS